MKEKVQIMRDFIDMYNAFRSYGIGRSAIVRQVRLGSDGSCHLTVLFPDTDFLFSFCLALKSWPDVVFRIDGGFLMLTIR